VAPLRCCRCRGGGRRRSRRGPGAGCRQREHPGRLRKVGPLVGGSKRALRLPGWASSCSDNMQCTRGAAANGAAVPPRLPQGAAGAARHPGGAGHRAGHHQRRVGGSLPGRGGEPPGAGPEGGDAAAAGARPPRVQRRAAEGWRRGWGAGCGPADAAAAGADAAGWAAAALAPACNAARERPLRHICRWACCCSGGCRRLALSLGGCWCCRWGGAAGALAGTGCRVAQGAGAQPQGRAAAVRAAARARSRRAGPAGGGCRRAVPAAAAPQHAHQGRCLQPRRRAAAAGAAGWRPASPGPAPAAPGGPRPGGAGGDRARRPRAVPAGSRCVALAVPCCPATFAVPPPFLAPLPLLTRPLRSPAAGLLLALLQAAGPPELAQLSRWRPWLACYLDHPEAGAMACALEQRLQQQQQQQPGGQQCRVALLRPGPARASPGCV
jgi:hypothetical protein